MHGQAEVAFNVLKELEGQEEQTLAKRLHDPQVYEQGAQEEVPVSMYPAAHGQLLDDSTLFEPVGHVRHVREVVAQVAHE